MTHSLISIRQKVPKIYSNHKQFSVRGDRCEYYLFKYFYYFSHVI